MTTLFHLRMPFPKQGDRLDAIQSQHGGIISLINIHCDQTGKCVYAGNNVTIFVGERACLVLWVSCSVGRFSCGMSFPVERMTRYTSDWII